MCIRDSEIINCFNKKILVDSAHNYSAAKALSEERKTWNNNQEGIYWILGVQKHKDISSMIKVLIKENDSILLVPVPNQVSWTLKDLSKINDLNYLNINEFEKVDLAFNYLMELKKWPKCNPVVTGSIFLVQSLLNLQIIKRINFKNHLLFPTLLIFQDLILTMLKSTLKATTQYLYTIIMSDLIWMHIMMMHQLFAK